jgi:RNA polymerase sigma-70 factor (ECF subfamily)
MNASNDFLSNDFLQEMTTIVPTLRAFGRSLCSNKSWADDLVQETMLKAWCGRDKFQSGSNMKAWLLTILRNQYYSELRHRKYEIEDPNDEHAARIAVPPEHEAVAELEALTHGLKTLPNEQREALLLVCASGLSYKQTAVICNCAVGTIKSRIARARDHLVTVLDLDHVAPSDHLLPTRSRTQVKRALTQKRGIDFTSMLPLRHAQSH